MSPVSVLSCNSVSSGTVSCRLAANSVACAEASRTLAVTSMRSPACSMSKPILSDVWLATTSTSLFFQDFTSMRPLATLWITTTGRVLTAKCLSTCWLAAACAGEIPEQKKAAAPSTGSMPRFISESRADRLIIPIPMLVDTPSAIHHRGQQFGFLLIGVGQVFTRQIILRFSAHTALAVSNKIIHLLQVLPERGVHRRGAGKLHVGEIDFLLVQDLGGFCERNLPSRPSNPQRNFRGVIRLPQLQHASKDDQQAHCRSGQSAASE